MPLPNLEAALELASLGYGVFALNEHGKPYPNCQPCRDAHDTAELYETCLCLMCHACYAATEDVERLMSMWDEEPDSLVGIRTGRFSNIFVLDIDQHTEDRNGIAEFHKLRAEGWLPETVSAETGGGGYHLYYRYPTHGASIKNNNKGAVHKGIDVKSDGGYVIAPPSCKPGKQPYRWLRAPERYSDLAECSPHILALIRKGANRFQERDRPNSFSVDLSKIDLHWFEQSLEQLEWTSSGRRNTVLYQAACRGGEVVAAGALTVQQVKDALHAKGASVGLRHNEIHATIRSGIARGQQDYTEQA